MEIWLEMGWMGMAWTMAWQRAVEPSATMDEAWMDLRSRLLLARIRGAWMGSSLALALPL